MITVLASILLAACALEPVEGFRDGARPPYGKAVSVAELATLRLAGPVSLIDVRLLEDFNADPVLIPGATYRNPEDIGEWSAALPAGVPVVVYCVRGRWVSQKAAAILAARGYDTRTLAGGIEAWKAAGSE